MHSHTVTIFLLFWLLLSCLLISFLFFFLIYIYRYIDISLYLESPHSLDEMGAVGVGRCVSVRVCSHKQSLSHCASSVCVAPQQIIQRGDEYVSKMVYFEFCGLIKNHQLNVNLRTKA